MYTVQDDLLVRVIFGKFVSGKLIHEFYIGDFCIELPIANINFSPINHLIQYMYMSGHQCNVYYMHHSKMFMYILHYTQYTVHVHV